MFNTLFLDIKLDLSLNRVDSDLRIDLHATLPYGLLGLLIVTYILFLLKEDIVKDRRTVTDIITVELILLELLFKIIKWSILFLSSLLPLPWEPHQPWLVSKDWWDKLFSEHFFYPPPQSQGYTVLPQIKLLGHLRCSQSLPMTQIEN